METKSPSKTPEQLHFIGIGGCGMSPLASIALDLGYQVSGSDMSESTAIKQLRQQGAKINIGHDPTKLPTASSVIYSTAIKVDNPELKAAKRIGHSILHRSELLKQFMGSKQSITVSGTHGKTTTTAMIGHLLHSLNLDPSFYCGGTPLSDLPPGRSGKGAYFVVEADESDRSFLSYDPFINVITDIGADHLDEYGSLPEVCLAFRQYAEKTNHDGANILYWDNPLMHELLNRDTGADLITYGKRLGSDVRLYDASYEGSCITYDIIVHRDRVKGRLNMLGEHNLLNLLATFAVARALDLDIEQAAAAMDTFQGVDRRLSLIHNGPYIKIYDDYAHNPQKIASSIQALRTSWPQGHIHVIFQPHRHSRVETLYNEFVESFCSANFVYVLPIYAAGETATKTITEASLAKDITKASSVSAFGVDSTEVLVKQLYSNLNRGDLVVSVGAGDVDKASYELKKFLETKEKEL